MVKLKNATDGLRKNVGGESAPAQLAGVLNAPPSRLLLSARDAATALSIGPRKLWELTNTKAILCVRIGRRVLYDPGDLRAYIDERKEGRR